MTVKIFRNGEKPTLYADIDGALYPVTRSLDGNKYQVRFIQGYLICIVINCLNEGMRFLRE